MGLLLAYIVFGRGTAKQSAAGASIIHFFGGIHEIYFPYVLMNPRLILAVIAGGMAGVFTLTVFDAGLVSPASPGSIFAVLLMTPKAAIVGVLASILAAAATSFAVAGVLMKTQRATDEEDESLEEASARMQGMKSASKGQPVTVNADMANVSKIIVACDAGMGSSAMGASLLRKKVEAAGLDISVTNCAINSLPGDVDIVITHKDLTDRARRHAADAEHISLVNFLDGQLYTDLVTKLMSARAPQAANDATVSVVTNDDSLEPEAAAVFQLSAGDIHLGLNAKNKEDAILFAGNKLVAAGYAEPEYVEAMLEREKLVPTYLGESIAVPHGTVEAKDRVRKTGIAICQYPAGIQFGEDEDDVARLVIAIAARNDEHIQVITSITNALDDPDNIERLANTKDVNVILEILGGNQAQAANA